MKKSLPISFIAMFFLMLTPFAWSEVKISKKMAFDEEDVIQKAQNLVLQKDRAQAIMMMVKYLNQSGSKAPSAEVKRNLDDISSVFLSEKTQQLYEANLSYKRKDVNQSLQKMNEALRIEPDNNLIIAEIARLQILKKDCRSASDSMEIQIKKNPYDELFQLTSAQAQACLKNWSAYQALRASKDLKKSNFKTEWLILDLDVELQTTANKIKMKDLLKDLEKSDSGNPQLIFWSGKIQALSEQNPNQSIDKYAGVCKNLSSAQFRKYFNDPYLCALPRE